MGAVTFEIFGKPFGKQRPRFARRGKFVATYTPEKTVSAESSIQVIANTLFEKPATGPVELIVVARFKPPKSWSKKKIEAHLGQPHLQKPDWDNIGKLVSDALNGFAYVDDSQICYCVVQKRWSEVAQTTVTVKEL